MEEVPKDKRLEVLLDDGTEERVLLASSRWSGRFVARGKSERVKRDGSDLIL